MAHEQSEQDLHGVDTCAICFTIHLLPRVGTKSGPAKPSLLRGKSAWGRIRHLEAPEMKLTDYGRTSDVYPLIVVVSKIKDEFAGV